MAVALRGSMDAAEYKHVVLGLLFLKYISDAFSERQGELATAVLTKGSDYYVADTAKCEFRKVWRGAFRKVWRVAQGSEGFQQVEPGEDLLARAAQMPTRVSGPGGG
jgi:type I restriction-modification system DNA methylase subunit